MQNQEKIQEVIKLLKEVDIDTETMEYVLNQVGLREQVVKQIIESEKYAAVKKLWDDTENNDTLWCPNFEAYYEHTFLS